MIRKGAHVELRSHGHIITGVVVSIDAPVLTQRQIEAALAVGAINAAEFGRTVKGLDAREQPPGLIDAYVEQRAADAEAEANTMCVVECTVGTTWRGRIAELVRVA